MDQLSIVAYVNKLRRRLRQLILRAEILAENHVEWRWYIMSPAHMQRDSLLFCCPVNYSNQVVSVLAAVSLSPRFQQYYTALLMLNGSHALYNPGYKDKIQYRQWQWVKHSPEMFNYWVIFLNTNWLTFICSEELSLFHAVGVRSLKSTATGALCWSENFCNMGSSLCLLKLHSCLKII